MAAVQLLSDIWLMVVGLCMSERAAVTILGALIAPRLLLFKQGSLEMAVGHSLRLPI